MNNLKKISRYGPGGRNCTCCGPAPSERKSHDRMVKRRERQDVEKHIQEEIFDYLVDIHES